MPERRPVHHKQVRQLLQKLRAESLQLREHRILVDPQPHGRKRSIIEARQMARGLTQRTAAAASKRIRHLWTPATPLWAIALNCKPEVIGA